MTYISDKDILTGWLVKEQLLNNTALIECVNLCFIVDKMIVCIKGLYTKILLKLGSL